jgi:hypothetical protein
MTDISFGPSTRPWHYFKSTKTYDLSGKSSNKLQFSATEGPEGTHVAIDPSSTALVIIDMQNFFLDARCMEHREGLAAVEPTIKVIEKCRAAGIRVSKILMRLILSVMFTRLTCMVSRSFGSTGGLLITICQQCLAVFNAGS